jgi:hypothetical protein
MILKHDGLKGEKVILINENIIVDLDADSYLRNLFYKKNMVQISQLSSGEALEIHEVYYNNELRNKTVTIDMREPGDGRYETQKGNVAVIKSGKLENLYYRSKLLLKNGYTIIVEHPFDQRINSYNVNNYVYYEDGIKPLDDGTYHYKTLKTFTVRDGRIIAISLFS